VDDTGQGLQMQTPNLDRLAAESVMFDRMRSEALPTIPCRRGIFTGRCIFPWHPEPSYKGIVPVFPGWNPVTQDDVTVAEHLTEQGYVTSIVADAYHIWKPSMNLHRGFQGFQWMRGQESDLWRTRPLPDGHVEQFSKPGVEHSARRNRVLNQFLKNHLDVADETDMPCARTFRYAIEWLEQNRTHEKFFLYLDTFSPHEPWLTPQKYLELYDEPDYAGPKLIYGNPYGRSGLTDAEHQHLRARYAGMCTMVDHWIGELLAAVDRLGLRESTLVVLMSDHGKIIGEFGHYGMPAQDTSLALNPVPCMLRHPEGENAGRRFGGWLYNVDLTATVLSLLAVEPKADVEGENVWPAVTDGADAFRDHLVTAYKNFVSVWQEDWLYLLDTEADTVALYNLADDPARTQDVAARYADVRDDLAGKAQAVLQG